MRTPRLLVVAAGALAFAAACQSSDVSRELGARCDHAKDCSELCLTPPEYPGGMCTTSCDVSDDCPSGALCVDKDNGVCLFSCTTDRDCDFLGTGWQCKAEDLHGAGVKGNVCRGG